MWNLLYRESRLLILTICLILVWGVSSFQLLPRMEDPEITQRTALIETNFPGANALQVESLVTEKIEQKLNEIKEIETIRSISRSGNSNVVIELNDEEKDTEQVWSRVRDRLSDLRPKLPKEVTTLEFQDLEARAYSMMVALTWELKSPVNYAILGRLGEELADRLRSVAGTEKVELFGTPQEEIVVEISPAELTALGLTAQELSTQIQVRDAKVAAGKLRDNQNNLSLEVDELDSLAVIRQIPLGKGEKFARLGDIATVKKGIVEPPIESAIVNNQPGIVLSILMESSQNANQWTDKMEQNLTQFQQQLSEGIALQTIFNQTNYVNNRLESLWQNLWFGILCVACSTGLMMGWQSAAIITLALPLTILMVFGEMRMLAIPLHQMSVTGLVIALGLLIDNAIVVVDEVQKKLKSGIGSGKALTESIGYIANPLAASTLTTVLTFTPIVTLSGNAGEFVGTMALTVILALISSLFVSLLIIPALTAIIHDWQRVSRPFPVRRNRILFYNDHGLSIPKLTQVYRQLLNFMFAKPIWVIVIALIVPMSGFYLASNLERQFFPPAERDQFSLEFELSSLASLEQTRLQVTKAREIILNHPEVINVHWFLGRNAPAFYYNLQRNQRGLPNYAQGLVQLKSAVGSRELIQNLQTELDRAFPSVRVLVKQLEQGPTIRAPIELHLYGSNLALLQELGNQVRLKMTQLANVTHVRTSLTEAVPKLHLEVDEESVRRVGLNNRAIAQQLDFSLEGITGGSVLEETEELPVRVRLANTNRSDLSQILSLNLLPETVNQDNSAVPLQALGKVEVVPEVATIHHRNGMRVNTIQGFLKAGILPSTVLNQLKQKLETDNWQLPTGYSFEFGGEDAEQGKAISNLLSTLSLLVLLMIATLVLSFRSFRSAAIIVLVGICSIGLGLFCLWLFDYPLGFMAILGIFGLIGIAINDSIVVLSALRADSQARWGDRQMTREVVVDSTRHVLTTTITTVAGFFPLFTGGGEFWSPLAICIVGGVGGSTLLAVSLVPCIYLKLISKKTPINVPYSAYKKRSLDNQYK